jgi:hypothetical protein
MNLTGARPVGLDEEAADRLGGAILRQEELRVANHQRGHVPAVAIRREFQIDGYLAAN